MGLPAVTVSYAQSLDGRIATRAGESRWISGPQTLRLSQQLRRDHDAILVGIGTVLRDDPLLTCRLPGCESPWRIVLDRSLRLPPTCQIARTASQVPVTVFGDPGNETAAQALRRLGVEIVDTGTRPLAMVLEHLAKKGIRTLYVEGGAAVITSFLKEKLVQRLIVVTAPIIIGQGIEAVADLEIARLADALHLRTIRLDRAGEDLVWELSLEP
jgi:5-amino-6-(5-phosphoribosylamino)uracil reductase/diaminohydroxyphosphoribosylaminopyrimidine deaminase/5-amino-6-(5-phosphoribosylamino)uracil reductase